MNYKRSVLHLLLFLPLQVDFASCVFFLKAFCVGQCEYASWLHIPDTSPGMSLISTVSDFPYFENVLFSLPELNEYSTQRTRTSPAGQTLTDTGAETD